LVNFFLFLASYVLLLLLLLLLLKRALRRQRETEKSNWTPHYFHPTADSKLADYDIKDKDKVAPFYFRLIFTNEK